MIEKQIKHVRTHQKIVLKQISFFQCICLVLVENFSLEKISPGGAKS